MGTWAGPGQLWNELESRVRETTCELEKKRYEQANKSFRGGGAQRDASGTGEGASIRTQQKPKKRAYGHLLAER